MSPKIPTSTFTQEIEEYTALYSRIITAHQEETAISMADAMLLLDFCFLLSGTFINADEHQHYQYILSLSGSPICDDVDAIDAMTPEIQRRVALHENFKARYKAPTFYEVERLIWPKRTSGRA